MKRQPGTVSRALAGSLLALTLAPFGCASKYGAQVTAVNHYPDCYQPIKELRQSEHQPQKSAAGGAAGGALIGALVGYLATGKASGAAVGAATGAVAGGAAGGIYGAQQQKSEDAARLSQYNQQLDGNITETDRATAAAKVARQCYERQFQVAAGEYKAGRLTKAQFNSRYQEVVNGMQEAAAILGEVNRNNEQITANYNRALQEETTKKASAPASGSKTAAQQKQQLAQMRQTGKKMEQSVKASQEEERLLLERLTATHQQAKDLMS